MQLERQMFSHMDDDLLESSDLADLSDAMMRASNRDGGRNQGRATENQSGKIIDVLMRQKREKEDAQEKKEKARAKLAAVNAFKHKHNQKQEGGGAPAELMSNPLYSRSKKEKKESSVGRAIGIFKKKNAAV
jgi:hypothetical protein